MQELPLELLEAVQDLVKRAYQLGYENGKRAQQEHSGTTSSVGITASPQAFIMAPREKDPSESYRDYFMKGSWPIVSDDRVRSMSVANLRLGTRAMNGLLLAVSENVPYYGSVTIGHILAIPPSKMLEDVRVRRKLSERGVEVLLNELARYGIVLQHPVV